MRILVIGSGYVGLTTASVLSMQYPVTIIDKDRARVQDVNNCKPPIIEEGLEDLLKQGVETGRLKAQQSFDIQDSYDLVMICVGTPQNSDGSVNLSYIESVMDDIVSHFDRINDGYTVIALRSTVSPGTTRQLILNRMKENFRDDRFGVVYSPEFLVQGKAIRDILYPHRIVFGSSDHRAGKLYIDIMKKCLKDDDVPIFEMSLESAELCKLASNSYLATKVSFVNELASLAEVLPHVDINDVMNGVTADKRINPSHMSAGLGFGGSCLPKDISNLYSYARGQGIEMKLLESVMKVNDETNYRLLRLLKEALTSIQGEKIAILGLSFKKGTDDTRCSPSISFINLLKSESPDIWVHDPMARIDSLPEEDINDIHICNSYYDCLRDASAAVLMTDWDVYEEEGLENLARDMKRKIFLDGRRVFVNSEVPPDVTYLALGTHTTKVSIVGNNDLAEFD